MNKVSTKRKYITEDFTNSKQKRIKNVEEAENNECAINNIINLGIPHIGEKIFSSVDTNELIQWMKVSKPWRVLIENVLKKRWNGKIFEACKDGKTEIVKILLANLKSKDELNYKGERGWTAFAWACKNGHKDVVKLLLDQPGSKHLRKNKNEENAYDAAEYGQDLSPFFIACESGHADVVKLFMQYSGTKNIDLNAAETGLDLTPFFIACKNGHTDVVKLMVDHTRSKNTIWMLNLYMNVLHLCKLALVDI